MTDFATAPSSRRTAEFDHHSPDLSKQAQASELQAGPLLGRERATCPLGWTEANDGYWFATGYKELKRIAQDDKSFSSDADLKFERRASPDTLGFRGVGIPPFPAQFGFLEMDGADHQGPRRALMPWLASAAVERWNPVIKDLTNAFLDDVIETGECDFIDSIASPIPAVLTMMMIGTPLNRWKQWAEAQHQQHSTLPGSPERAHAEQLVGQHVRDLVEVIAARRADPPTGASRDLLDVLCHEEVGGRMLSDEEVLIHCILLVGGGVDTTTSLMGSAVKWLAAHPEQRSRLREDPNLMKTAIEEFLRVFAPVTGLARTAGCPVHVGDQTIDEGERVFLAYAAANFDPEVFEDADTVKLDRWPNRHTTFGMGAHRCIGLHVARAVINTVLTEVLNRMPDFEVDPNAVEMYHDLAVNQGWVALPITFTPGPRVGSEFKPSDAAPTVFSQTAASEATRVIAEMADVDEVLE